MAASDRPEIFISATSGDLRSCRQLIKEALLTLGCVPVEQTNFPPDATSVREMLRTRIAACHAVMHLAGVLYGAEPQERNPDELRRSYTQLEYDIARELGKPIYVFVCGDGFPYDEHTPEDSERRALQQSHRDQLQAGDHLFTPVGTRDELALRVHALQTRVKLIEKSLRRSRRWLGRGVAVGLLLALVLGGGLWAVNRRTSKTEERIAQVETELERQRRTIKAVADAYTQQQAQLAELKLSDAQLFERAVATVARRESIPVAELEAGINLFVTAINSDPSADFLDRALADFAQQKFAAASENAGHAADEARAQRLAAEKLAAQATDEARAAADRERAARNLQGQSLYAERRYGEAAQAFEAALAVTPRTKQPELWAELQRRMGLALSDWASVSTGAEIAARRAASIAAFHSALEVYNRAALPKEWATTQNDLASALNDQARAADGPERAKLLDEAVTAYRAALEVRTRATFPQDWAITQNNLAAAIGDQALTADVSQRAKLLGEAVAAFRAALEVQTRADQPQDWALTQNNLGIALYHQAQFADASERARLLQEAVGAFRAALEVRTRAALPQEWAATQSNLANVLQVQSMSADPPERARIRGEAVDIYRSVLEVRSREEQPQDWAMTQVNLGNALQRQSLVVDVRENSQVRAQAIAAYRAALEVYTREFLPQTWAATQNNLGLALRDQALMSQGAEQEKLLVESVTALRDSLDVYTRESMPQDWAMTQNNLAMTLHAQASKVEGPERERLLGEALTAMRSSLELLSVQVNPSIHADRTQWIADVEGELRELEIRNSNIKNKNGGYGPPPQ